MSEALLKRALWPSLNDATVAKSVARRGAWLAVLVAVVLAIFSERILGAQPFQRLTSVAVVDVSLFLILAAGIWAMSRTAAALALLFWVLAILWALQHHRRPSTVIIAIAFAFVFLGTLRATRRFHQIQRMGLIVSNGQQVDSR